MKVVILCGGKGTRLLEETKTRPKPLVDIGGRPILMHIIQSYLKHGFSEFKLASGYLGEQIENFVSESDLLGKVTVIDTGQDTLTGGRLLRLKSNLVKEKMFMLTYGDGVCNVDLKKLVNFHVRHGKIATVTAVRPPARFGVMKLNEDEVEYFNEKAQTDTGWINGGYFVFNSEIFNYLKDDTSILEQQPLEKLTSERELMAFKHEGFWQCMDTLRDKNYLDELCKQGITPWL